MIDADWALRRGNNTDEGERKVIRAPIDREPAKEPLAAYFGGVSLNNNKWATVNEQPTEPTLRTLRTTWRGLETGPWGVLTGHVGENAEHS